MLTNTSNNNKQTIIPQPVTHMDIDPNPVNYNASITQTYNLTTQHSNYSNVSPSHDYTKHVTEPNMEINSDNSNDASDSNQNAEYTVSQNYMHEDNINYASKINHITKQPLNITTLILK